LPACWRQGSSFRAQLPILAHPEGVSGVRSAVSTNFIFLFVLFGALLERAAPETLSSRSRSRCRPVRGDRKAAVVSSGMTGMISGSSVANVSPPARFTSAE